MKGGIGWILRRSKSEILRLLWDIVIFRLVVYLLNMVCLILQILYKIWYIRFGIIFTQFYINFSRQEHQIDVLYVSFKTWDSQVSAYTPFHFSFTVPLISLISMSELPVCQYYDCMLVSKGFSTMERKLEYFAIWV